MTKGSIFLRAALFFCFSLVFLSEKFTSECFFITPVGYPLHLKALRHEDFVSLGHFCVKIIT